MKSDRPTIGFFTCHLDNSYAYEVCKGVIYAAREADVNLVIFPGMFLNASYNDPVNAKYDYQYNSIFYYADQHTLDALIVSMGSIGSFLTVEDNKAFLDHFDIPILTLETEVPGYPCLYTESDTGLREAVEHIIKSHHKKKIGFVSGRLENDDARQRFEIYKNVLAENSIKYDEKLIAYGNFSEYSEEIVTKLLEDNPDIEAIVFANDQMAIGGYKAINKKGLVIGKDILVTGFDNSINSLTLFPPLTTVDNNTMDIGYNSIYQALELLSTGHTSKNVLHSNYIPRNSCPADPVSEKRFLEDINRTIHSMDSMTLLKAFKDFFMKEHLNSFYSEKLFMSLDPFFLMFADIASGKKADYTSDDVVTSVNELYNDPIIVHYFTHIRLTNAITKLNDCLKHLDLDEKIKNKLSELFTIAVIQLSNNLGRSCIDTVNEYKAHIWNSENITKDTLIAKGNKNQCFRLILDKLNQCGFKSSYIYLYNSEPVRMLPDGFWTTPDNLVLEAYSKYGRIYTYGSSNIISKSKLFLNEYTDDNTRSTLVITPIYTNDEQHGLFICEADLDTFSSVYSSCLQLGTALKFISLTDDQYTIRSRLEATMNEINIKNDMLNNLSTKDELTGLLNRRGFFEMAEGMLANPYHSGLSALIAFIDMNNLKQVNDIYGHKEGDYSLKSIASTLIKCFPEKSVIARIGGDEFIVFSMDTDEMSVDHIKNLLDESSLHVNSTSGKPYYIEFSYGFNVFTCTSGMKLDGLMMAADKELYENKKKKRKNVNK
ncbi:diguanylate cyclase (GGDEF) domain-containing protein [Eubacterium ruminantium]|nr:diguanylate cyclase (GGDEF) domain-containing protein [Eubacterium ruminantium]